MSRIRAALRPPRTTNRIRRALALAAPAAVAALLTCAPGALAGAFTPEHGGSPNADEINSLYVIALVIAAVVFLGVEGVLLYSLFKFKARKGRQAAQIHGNTRLELGWTIGAALILVVLTVVTFVKLGPIKDPAQGAAAPQVDRGVLTASTSPITPPGGRKLNVCVTGRQYIWRFTYSDDCSNAFGKPYTYEQMTVPAGVTVTLDIQATDVIHSWWIPKLGGKFDAVPGYHNYTWFKAPTPGKLYTGNCAELCGRNHADMKAAVRVVSPDEYRTFIQNLTANISSANKEASRLRDTLHRRGDL
jgi:cytochrome c oxidase subunit 2